jgi:nucleotide-binding universal stress UspA family protein
MALDDVQARIVVGVDGSSPAQAAVGWAAAEAAVQQRPLHVVHGFIWPLVRPRVSLESPVEGLVGGGLQAAAEGILDDAATQARSVSPGLEVTTELVVGEAAAAMLARTAGAQMLVLGSRGMGGFLGLLVGSVSVKVASHAPCPVVVVRPRDDGAGEPSGAAGRVVVGVDGSDVSALAVRFAFETAARRGVGLTALRAWDVPAPVHPSLLSFLPKVEEEESQELTHALDGDRRRFPDVDVRTQLVNGHAAQALVRASRSAELVVVGSRGRGGFTGMLLGSVSQAVLQHAHGPVAVVRPHD